MTKRPQNAWKITFADALGGAASLVHAEHAPGRPCEECKATLALLKQTKKALDDMALGNALVWPAVKASARTRRPTSSRRKRRRV